MLLHNISI